MKVDKVSVKYGRKFNLGDYESIDVEVFYCGIPEEDESPEDCVEYLTQMAKQSVKTAALDVLKSSEHQISKARVAQQYMGKVIAESSWTKNTYNTEEF